ncbi:uncharacterized protein M6B38_314925 [Iris pallida]|uniref:Uncharacterized protein n=1 Tax=Iris pallida TaxID=29817 RepID=A0AAX6HEK0_IRIPA|nr:uncharacterized protein M6B38_314925 [Iris pallida]
MYSCTYSCTHPSRSHMLVVFQILCTCHVLYFKFMVYILVLYFLYFTFMYFHILFLYFIFHVLLYSFPYHDVLVYYLELYFAPLLTGYVTSVHVG